MLATVILTLVGIFLGAVSFGSSGWWLGGIIGFLSGNLIRLATDLKLIANKVLILQKQVAEQLAKQTQATAPADTQTQAPAAQPRPQTQQTNVAASNAVTASATTTTKTMASVIDEDIDVAKHAAAQGEQRQLATATQQHKPAPSNQPEAAYQKVTLAEQSADSSAARQTNMGIINAPKPSAQATPVDKLFAAISRFFTEGNPVVRVGILVMFFGLSFLVKYAAGQGLVPIQLRLLVVAGIALILVILGWKTRAKADGYGLVLQGGGLAGIYLTVFAALKLYGFLSPSLALSLMLVMVMLGAALAILQNAQILALVATAGGFLSPILTSDGSGSHITLFSFYLLLNIGILTIAWFKTWRALNWVGFMFTFVITATWEVLQYEPEFYASTQPFLICFFALYLLLAILFSIKQPPKLTGLVDGSLIFGLPIVAFGLQAKLLQDTDYGLAISAVILAIVYAVLAGFLRQKYRATLVVLIESFIALSIMFFTLAIPLALDAEWTSASWALEATGLVWVGLRQNRLRPRIAGYVLHAAAAVALLKEGLDAGSIPIITGNFIGMFMLSSSALCIAYLFYVFGTTTNTATANLPTNDNTNSQYHLATLLGTKGIRDQVMAKVALIIGWLWWLLAGLIELEAHLPSQQMFVAVLFYFTFSWLLVAFVGRLLSWSSVRQLGFWLMPLSLLWLITTGTIALFNSNTLHPLKDWGSLALPLLFIIHYRFLWQERAHPIKKLLSAYHIVSAWMILGVVFWEAAWWQNYYQWYGLQGLLLWFLCLSLPLLALLVVIPKPCWPFLTYRDEYKNIIPTPSLLLLLFWFIDACGHSGVSSFGYLPVLNLLDLAQLACIILFTLAARRDFLEFSSLPKVIGYRILSGAVFIYLNLVVLRSVHYFAWVEYQPKELWQSHTAQMAMSILWTLCAMVVMYIAHRRQARNFWFAGAGLLILVVAKLFTQDLQGSGSLAGIVSFMVVGGLMLLIGYVSPLPAKTQKSGDSL